MKISSWKEAEGHAETYLRLTSEIELLDEAFKKFAEARKAEIGREREIPVPNPQSLIPNPGLILGFKKIPAEVRVPADSLEWLESFGNGRFIRHKPEAKKSPLKNYLLAAGDAAVEKFSAEGIVLVSGYDQFYLKLARHQRAAIAT